MRMPLLRTTVATLVAVQLAGCGYLLYPERAGQPKGGRIDPAVAILDGIGCLLFLIPGLVAFAVDFHKGTIYLPRSAGPAPAVSSWRPVAHADLTPTGIERAVLAATGVPVSLTDPRLQAYRMTSAAALPAVP